MEIKDDKYELKRNKIQKGFRRLTSIVFAFDGTRRWYLAKNNLIRLSSSDEAQYCEKSAEAFYKIVQMCFEFDIKYLTYPMWYHTLYERGENYMPLFMRYMLALYKWLVSEEGKKVRTKLKLGVVFFGNERNRFYESADKLCYDELIKLEKEIYEFNVVPHRWLILGILTKPHEDVTIEETVKLARASNKRVERRDLVKSYYGMHIDDVQVYIAFDTFTTESYPSFIMNDKANLYFTRAPHPYLDKDILKNIFKDYLIKRVNQNPSSYDLDHKDLKKMNRFYKNNAQCVSGVGVEHKKCKLWFPE